MPAQSRVYSKDEELGKRDDDFRPKRRPTASPLMQPWRWRRRRLLAVLAVVAVVVVLLRILPQDLGPIDQRAYSLEALRGVAKTEPVGPPPRPWSSTDDDASKHYYDGQIKFYRLATSLHGIARTMGTRPQNRNVLFATASLQSVANLIPMACEMAKWDRNYVHLTLMGRDSLPLNDILEINGYSEDDCMIYFHDARSDYSEYSSDKRAEAAVFGAMKHVNDFMHPQAIITDDSAVEDTFFTSAMRSKAKDLNRALIEIPATRYEEFLWMTRLDSGSLSNWHRPTIDIIVHAPPESSGGLMRLVKSLEGADYAGLQVPRLTIELPSTIETFAKRYLEGLDWPPISSQSPGKQRTLMLHHRIPSSHVSSEQAAVRFVESFYPKDSSDNHVLVLSAQADLSPLYLQYLHYALLEYKYSSYGSPGSENLLGVSLDVPANFLNGSGVFSPPLVSDMKAQRYTDMHTYDQDHTAPFLYQASSATASLIFGDKWATFHDFLTNRLMSSHAGKAEKVKKLVSETQPAWLEYLLELMRARGWSMLHPANAFVTVHNELAQILEEYMRESGVGQKGAEVLKQSDHPEEEPFLIIPKVPVISDHVEHDTQATQPLHEVLPFDGDLPELPHLPDISHAGEIVSLEDAQEASEKYVPEFRRKIGGCKDEDAKRKRVISDWTKTEDLFCLPGQELDFDLAAEESPEEVAQAVIAETAGPEAAGVETTEDELEGEAEIATPDTS